MFPRLGIHVLVPSKEISLDPPHSRAFLEIIEKPAAINRPSTAHVSDEMQLKLKLKLKIKLKIRLKKRNILDRKKKETEKDDEHSDVEVVVMKLRNKTI